MLLKCSVGHHQHVGGAVPVRAADVPLRTRSALSPCHGCRPCGACFRLASRAILLCSQMQALPSGREASLYDLPRLFCT